jgi:uncharacterized protein (TIGR02246 family)
MTVSTVFRPCVLVCLMVALTACRPANRAFTPQDEAAIRTASMEYMKAETAGDFNRWFAFSTPDAVYMPAGSKLLQGREAVAAWFRELTPGATLEGTTDEVLGHDDVAIVRGTYTAAVPATQAGPALRATGNYIAVWQRQPDGSWRITRNIWNADGPVN